MKKDTKISIVWWIFGWIILGIILYLLQALWMWSLVAPIDYIKDEWYFMLPLVIWFWLQIWLYKAIKLKYNKVNKGMIVWTGSISWGWMLACCMHNLVLLFPILWLSWLSATFAIYQNWILWFSVFFMLIWVWYMIKKYREVSSSCCK